MFFLNFYLFIYLFYLFIFFFFCEDMIIFVVNDSEKIWIFSIKASSFI